jgi:SAM-dependent methyltransferase
MIRHLTATALDLMYVSLGLTAPWVFGSPWWVRRGIARYRRLAARYDSQVITQTPGYSAPFDAVLGHLGDVAGRVLDVSTGTGAVALVLAGRFPRAEVHACDVSVDMLKVAQQKAAAAGLSITWHRAESTRLPFPDASFDLVFLQNAPLVPAELARVARPGGRVVLCYTKGGAMPAFLERRLARRLEGLHVPVVTVGRVRGGLYIVARRSQA